MKKRRDILQKLTLLIQYSNHWLPDIHNYTKWSGIQMFLKFGHPLLGSTLYKKHTLKILLSWFSSKYNKLLVIVEKMGFCLYIPTQLLFLIHVSRWGHSKLDWTQSYSLHLLAIVWHSYSPSCQKNDVEISHKWKKRYCCMLL